MPLPTHPILRAVAWLSAACLAAGCSSSDSRAKAALGEYQTAAAANDLSGARRALMRLVSAKDDVADYWAQLGKVQASMGSYNDAYYAFTRAYELDRSNPDLLRALTELALRSGDLDMAQSRAEELGILVPGDPWIKLVKGWAAVSEMRFDEALAISDDLLASAPFDSAAKILKARALVGLRREDEAATLLTEQIRVQPADFGSMALLSRIYERRSDWAHVEEIASRLVQLNPADQTNSLLLVQAAFRAGDIGRARQASVRLLRPAADPSLISSVLDLWAIYWPSPQSVDDARALANDASGPAQKLAYAEFLSRAGNTAEAMELVAQAATLPVTADNAQANAILADAMWRRGNGAAAKTRFDAVLAFDPGNATALRGRSELALRSGNAGSAIADAQKLVSVSPDSARDRLLLARAFSAAGNARWADRTLWTAFEDIPANDQVFAGLKARQAGNPQALSELQAEFERQRNAKLNRGLL
jgi:tetratricopeptide (TPR) repeat protein